MALARPKVGRGRGTSKGARYHTYSPSSPHQRLYKEAVICALSGNKPIPRSIMDGPVAVSLSFCFSRPLHHFTKEGDIRSQHQSQLITIRKADLDNCLKFVLDAIQGVLINDDHQVMRISCDKCWSNNHTQPGRCGDGYSSITIVPITSSSFEQASPLQHNTSDGYIQDSQNNAIVL